MGMLAELRDNKAKKHRLRLSDAIGCGLFLRDVGYWHGSAPGVMASRARAVHHRQRTARQEYYRGDNQ